MVTPVTSEGSRSGVNWMRVLVPCTVAAIERAREVLPVPGASSSSTWPGAIIEVSTSRTTSFLPSTAWPTLWTSLSKVSANQLACSGVIVTVGRQLSVEGGVRVLGGRGRVSRPVDVFRDRHPLAVDLRSEEHTSELQSRVDL